MPYATNKGVKIWYEVAGEGPAMVLLHSNRFDQAMFLYQAGHFSTWFRVVSVDLRSYGRTDSVTTPFTIADMAGDVMEVCRQEGITQAIVGGVSTGSGVALLIGIEHPDFCRALILVGGGSTLSPPPGGVVGLREGESGPEGVQKYHQEDIEKLLAPDFPKTAIGRYLVNLFIDRAKAQRWTAEGILQLRRARQGTDLTPRLSEVKVPTLVVNGEFDNALKYGARTAELTPGAVHRVLKGAGHCCNLDDPAAFDAVLIEFLKAKGLLPAV